MQIKKILEIQLILKDPSHLYMVAHLMKALILEKTGKIQKS